MPFRAQRGLVVEDLVRNILIFQSVCGIYRGECTTENVVADGHHQTVLLLYHRSAMSRPLADVGRGLIPL